jgi:hypothetical protein
MNPKDINNLDPKLKETYDRVMGTSLGANPTAAPATMEVQPIAPPQEKAQTVVPQPAEQNPLGSAQPETSTPDTNVSQVFRADSSSKPSETANVSSPSFKKEAPKKMSGNKLLPIIVVVAIVFFAIYAVVWAKLLGLF